MLAEMSRAGVFVSPALYEPFGLGVLEAAANGCALVLSDVPTFRELWDGAALFADPREPKALREAIATACRDGSLRAELQTKARARAARYPLERTVERYTALYARLVAVKRREASVLQEACA
jgi:glycosyltransferase involved in cell wall biosynthesis